MRAGRARRARAADPTAPPPAAAPPRRARVAALGAAAAVAYLVAGLLSFEHGLLPARPLYDGTAPPPPYRWVSPPPELAGGNQQPSGGKGSVALSATGSEAANINTDDGQAVVIFPPNGISPKAGERKASISIEPIDPVTIGSPPSGLGYYGNAYRFTAAYASSGAPAEIAAPSCPPVVGQAANDRCATIVLRYPYNVTEMYRRDGGAWTKLPAQVAGAALQVYAETPVLGVFIAVGPKLGVTTVTHGRRNDWIAFVAGLAVILLGTWLARARALKKRRRSTSKKRKPPPPKARAR